MNTIRILIADDQPFIRAGIKEVLTQVDTSEELEIIECDPGDHGNEAIRQISAHFPDVIILDIGYPLNKGLEVAREISRALPGTQMLLLSANPEEDDDELLEVIKTGVAGYLRSRACSPSELLEIMKQVSNGEYPINKSVGSRPKVAWRVLKQFQEILSDVRKEDDIITPLTSRESQILTLVAEGNQNKQIARILGVSEQTIKNHVSTILRKLNANDRAHAVMLAIRNGLVPVPPSLGVDRRRMNILSTNIISTS